MTADGDFNKNSGGKNMKRSLLPIAMLAIACTFATGIASVPAETVKAAGDVEINETNFPDEKFRVSVSYYDKNKDNKLSEDEIKAVTEIGIYSYVSTINNLKGIEYFTYLTHLNISEQPGIESIDLSKNVNLKYLHIGKVKLSSLDLSKNTKLIELSLNGTDVASLDLGNNPDLKFIDLGTNKISTLDLSKNTKIFNVTCSGKDLKNIIFPKDCSLNELDISKSQLSDLDLSDCTSVKYLKCTGLGYTSLPDFKCSNIERLDCSDNNIKEADLSRYINIRYFECQSNKLEKIDVSKCKNLLSMTVNVNALTSLDVSKNTKLKKLDCGGNQLTSLDLSKNLKLKELGCGGNKLTSLDISNNNVLERLYCPKNDITKLDISSCPKLVIAYNEGDDDSEGDNTIVSRNLRDREANLEYWITFDSKVDLVSSAISVTAERDAVVCGKTTTCKVDLNGRPADTAITWLSSDENIATVDANGKVTTKMAGLVTITAQTPDNVKAKVNITVLYKDVTNSKAFWYLPTNRMTALGVVKGYKKQTLFKPANLCTRAQMVTFMWRLMGEPEPKSDTCNFSDVKKTDYFYKACIWGNENHIVEGYKNGTFGPQIICARKHAVTFLWRLAGCPESTEKNRFKDVKKSDYYYDAVRWASRNGILEGYKDGTFRPNGDCLRRQMVTFLDRFNSSVLRSDS